MAESPHHTIKPMAERRVTGSSIEDAAGDRIPTGAPTMDDPERRDGVVSHEGDA